MIKRYLIEGTWSGYTSGQRRVVHREYTKCRAFAELVGDLRAIRYTDGTMLHLTVSEVSADFRRKGAKMLEIKGYGDLIRECVYAKVDAVSDLPKYKKVI